MSKQINPYQTTLENHPPRPGYLLVPCDGPAHDEDSEEGVCKRCAPRWGWVEVQVQKGTAADYADDLAHVEALEGVPYHARTGAVELLTRGPRQSKTVRASKGQWEAYERAARTEGRSLNAWILRALDRAADGTVGG